MSLLLLALIGSNFLFCLSSMDALLLPAYCWGFTCELFSGYIRCSWFLGDDFVTLWASIFDISLRMATFVSSRELVDSWFAYFVTAAILVSFFFKLSCFGCGAILFVLIEYGFTVSIFGSLIMIQIRSFFLISGKEVFRWIVFWADILVAWCL